tara:strand:- start:169 stop:993 length:825 start_codon:yes stop_codon:yes gene_type:complete
MDMTIHSYKLRLKIFIFFTIILLLESFFYYYSYKLSYFCFNELTFANECKTEYSIFDRKKSGFNPYIWNENRIVEIFQTLFLFFTIIIFIKIIKFIRKKISNKLFIYLIYLYLICLLYFFLEEISWGQHIFKWESSSFFLINNNQGETNLHNISNLFDQLPRGLLLIWCAFPFVIQKILKILTKNKIYYKFVFPQKELIYISLILILFFLPDFIIDKMNLHPGHGTYTLGINKSEIYDFISFKFIRLSEFQELIFTFYLFNHALFFKKFIYFKS